MAEGNGTNGVARIGVWASVAGVTFVLLAALFGLFWTANSAYRDVANLGDRVKILEAQDIVERTQINSLCSDLVEVETQFRASDQVRNLMQANNLRVESLLWRKTFAVEYPAENPYLPTIAQDQPTPCR